MATYLILAAVVLICAYAVYSYIRKLRVGGGCCGEQSGEGAAFHGNSSFVII